MPKKGTGNTNRVKKKEGREATRARKWGEKTTPKVEKKIARLEKKVPSIPKGKTKQVMANEVKTRLSKDRLAYAKQAAAEHVMPLKKKMDTIAGRTSSGKRTASDNKITTSRVAVKEIAEVKSDIKKAKSARKRNIKS